MNPPRDTNETRERLLERGYRVDPVAVADAIVRRRWTIHVAARPEAPAPLAHALTAGSVASEER